MSFRIRFYFGDGSKADTTAPLGTPVPSVGDVINPPGDENDEVVRARRFTYDKAGALVGVALYTERAKTLLKD